MMRRRTYIPPGSCGGVYSTGIRVGGSADSNSQAVTTQGVGLRVDRGEGLGAPRSWATLSTRCFFFRGPLIFFTIVLIPYDGT